MDIDDRAKQSLMRMSPRQGKIALSKVETSTSKTIP